MRRLLLLGVAVAATSFVTPWGGASAAADVTFAKDVAPILNAKCVTCHRPGEVAPMALRTFEEARPWARAIKEKVVSRQMPPWFADRSAGTFSNDPSLTDKELATIAAWVDAGAPQGNSADMPAARQFTDGWQLGEPDYIVDLPEVHVPAKGPDYFPTPSLTLDIAEDHWVRAVEIRPSNREVTHHSVLFSSGGGMGSNGFFDVLAVWAVGTPPSVYPEGTGRWLHKGQRLSTNLHYHPNGKTEEVDRTRVGFYFGKGDLKKEVTAALAGNMSFVIPPQASHHELRAAYVVDQDISIISFFPHMHFRGKDMLLTATLPGGQKQILLNVPSYDFNWQLFYYPTSRIHLPRGTRVDIVAHYDNSAANRNNPDPNRAVTFGEASTDEMMFGLFEFVADEGVSPRPASDRTRMEALLSTLPADSSYMVDVPLGRRPLPSVLHLPRSGDAAWYVATNRMITVLPITQLVWDGDAYQFSSEQQIGANNIVFTVKGRVDADGTIRGTVETPFGMPAAAPAEFTGTRGTSKAP
jgi:hypothetical protein